MSKRFVRVARVSDVPNGSGKHVEVGDHVLAVFQHQGRIFVVDGTCPHQGGPLAEGYLDAEGVVTCPWHAWQFNVATGKSPDSPALRVACYPVEVREGEVFVELEEEARR